MDRLLDLKIWIYWLGYFSKNFLNVYKILLIIITVISERSEGDGSNRHCPPRIQQIRDYISQYADSVANFYSPLESPVGMYLIITL